MNLESEVQKRYFQALIDRLREHLPGLAIAISVCNLFNPKKWGADKASMRLNGLKQLEEITKFYNPEKIAASVEECKTAGLGDNAVATPDLSFLGIVAGNDDTGLKQQWEYAHHVLWSIAESFRNKEPNAISYATGSRQDVEFLMQNGRSLTSKESFQKEFSRDIQQQMENNLPCMRMADVCAQFIHQCCDTATSGHASRALVSNSKGIIFLAKLAAIIPVSTASVERSFSAVTLCKTKGRSSMSDAHLECLLAIRCNGPPSVLFDYLAVVLAFASDPRVYEFAA